MQGGFAALRDEIRSGDEETRRQMRLLHEDVIGRIALLQNGLREKPRPAAARQRGRKPRKR